MANNNHKLWNNEYFKTIITIVLIVIVVFGLWFGVQTVLGTEYPALAVASTSMLPTLKVGDLIIVQKVDAANLNAHYQTGDIVVFKSPTDGKLIVHRAVKKELRNNEYWIITHGDNNPPDAKEKFPETYLVGKVIAKIPYIGNLALLIHSDGNWYIFTVIIIILIIIFLMFPLGSEEKEEKPERERKILEKIDLKIIYLAILNILIISFAVFSLWGNLTFWQPGADPPQLTAIHGMFADLQFHESFNHYSYNHVVEALLSQGFLTYTINDQMVDGSLRLGIPTFSWFQFSIITLIAVNIWQFYGFWRRKKTEKPNAL
ncbi:signal peptidase I [Candidatus Bathyarchaeota archaeon]|nr:MAG: signal peptidase I [Candidatus Bathyarchaeota archaeon]